MSLRLCSLALAAYSALAAPTVSSQPQMPFGLVQNATNTNSSSQFFQYSAPWRTAHITSGSSVASTTSLSNLTNLPSSHPTTVTFPLSPSPSSLYLSSTSSPSLPTSTIFVTKVVTASETTSTPPLIIITTVVVTATAAATVPMSPSPSWDNCSQWFMPPQMTDLSPFNITYFPSGQRNLHIVAQTPAKDTASQAGPLQPSLLPVHDANATLSAILQLVYPAHSVNPGSKPEGGADFYATPINLAGAHNVTLEYSVFFPADFDWVKGGKLPGLFGGHTGCSGGSSARDCFSTRLMWRPHGAGELYLYAPKDKQTPSLCEAVGSVCDAAYGFSVGRGAFNFTPGDWTHLRQNVVLNTPGGHDGVFALFVDGRPGIERTDVFYRDVVRRRAKHGKGSVPSQPAEFLGLFFSTFFGGHGRQYATPKQQYTWFKDFAITRHD